jgi:hypothetical protein
VVFDSEIREKSVFVWCDVFKKRKMLPHVEFVILGCGTTGVSRVKEGRHFRDFRGTFKKLPYVKFASFLYNSFKASLYQN